MIFLPRRPVELVLKHGGCRSCRIGVGHLKDARYAAQHRAHGAGAKVFLMGRPGFSEMDLTVDHTGQDVQSGGIDHLTRIRLPQLTNRGDLAVPDPDVGLRPSVLVYDGPAANNHVKSLGHGESLAKSSHTCDSLSLLFLRMKR